MKILQHGKRHSPATYDTTCKRCDARVELARADVTYVDDFRDGNAWRWTCPECSTENWIAASLVSFWI